MTRMRKTATTRTTTGSLPLFENQTKISHASEAHSKLRRWPTQDERRNEPQTSRAALVFGADELETRPRIRPLARQKLSRQYAIFPDASSG
jgi:hypothetical protein